ncbi:MAG TPA: SRPBCC domain-containing protein [Ktedonobacterales bacterium]|nr:SRPBCC domain-containing protein [Ktedonobacterales bacterium]
MTTNDMSEDGFAQLPSGAEILRVEQVIPGCSPVRAFAYWTTPDLICSWWPREAEIEPHAGGAYHLIWPDMGWRLRGRYTAFEPGRQLAFTWAWDHDPPETTPKLVTVSLAPTAEGTHLTLEHGFYDESPEEQELRIEHHLAGWRHFLPALRRVARTL